MSWSQGFLNGFSTVNNAIQGWEDRKERREQRDEDRAWQQKTWDYRVQRDEKNDAVNADNTTWNRSMEEKKLKETVNTNRATIAQGNSRLAIASQQLDIQKQLKNLQLINAQRQLEDQDAESQRQMVDFLIGNGDIAGAKAITDGMNARTGGIRKLMMDNPNFGAGVYMPAYQDSFNRLKGIGNSDEERIAFLNSEAMIKNINAMDQDSLSHNIGTQGKFGEIVKQEYIGARPVPGADGKPKPGKIAYMVRSYNKDGKFYDAPVTQFRTSSGKDPVREFSFDELFENYTARANWVTQVMQRNLTQKQQQGLSIAEQAKLYGQTINAASHMGQSPDEATQFADGVVAKFSNQGQGNGPLSQAANNQNDLLQQLALTNNNVSGLLNSREIQALIKTPEGKEAVHAVIRGAQNKGTLSKFTPQILAENVNRLLNTKQKGNSQRVQDYIQFKVAMDKKEAENRSGVPMN